MNRCQKIYRFTLLLLVIFPIIYSLMGLGIPFLYGECKNVIVLFIPESIILCGYYMWMIAGVLCIITFIRMILSQTMRKMLLIYGSVIFICSGILGFCSLIIYSLEFGSFLK